MDGRVTVDIVREMNQLTLAIPAKTLFNHNVREDQSVVRAAVDALLQQTSHSWSSIVLKWVPTPANHRAARVRVFPVRWRIAAVHRRTSPTGRDETRARNDRTTSLLGAGFDRSIECYHP